MIRSTAPEEHSYVDELELDIAPPSGGCYNFNILFCGDESLTSMPTLVIILYTPLNIYILGVTTATTANAR